MNLTKRLIALLLAVLMLPIWNTTVAEAAEVRKPKTSDSGTLIGNVNPLYQGICTADDFVMPDFQEASYLTAQSKATYVTEAQAATQLRNYMKSRTGSFLIYVESQIDNVESLMDTMIANAAVHTGNPTEGDYILWQWGRWDVEYSYSRSDNTYYYTLNLVFSYYTTADQEQQVDAAVKKLISSLNLSGKSDYEKIKSVYDYICANVTYDYGNLNDASYKLKFSAYAALINKTAVCQGYALLFYRLMLELGIDARFISGIGGGGAHGWNIVKLGDVYYNMDATWDAGTTEYSFFLINTWNFADHYRDPEYDTMKFHKAYHMAAENYDPNVPAKIEPYIYIGYCGDTAAYAIGWDGTLTITGTGETYDYYPSMIVGDETAPWRSWGEDITKLVVGDGITALGESSCFNMDGLTSIELPGSLKTIGARAFENCDSLTTLNISEGVTTLERLSFSYSGIVDLTLPETLVNIESETFRRCEKLKTVIIPASVASLGAFAFGSCDSLETISFLGDAPSMDTYLFENTVATAYYPKDNDTWTEDVLQNYSGTITWEALGVTGWVQEDGVWYYYDNGDIQTGWLKLNDVWYYLKSDGAMATGWVQVGNTWYYMNSSGAMQTGWLKQHNDWYYLKSDGSMAKGWALVNHVYYYFDQNGKMVTGWVLYNGTYYYLKSNGAMATGWQLVNHVYFYFEPSGAMRTGWLLYKGTYYYLKPNGAMATGWVKVGSDWYFMNSSGAMQTGWLQQGNIWYYLKPNGAMATGEYWMNNRYYYFDANGVWIG